MPPGSDSKHIDDNTILTATHKEHPFGASTDPEFNLDVHQNIPSSKLFRAYRSALFNIFLIGLIALTQTGLWTALNNVGAGGASEPWLYNAGSALTFGIMSFGCSIAGVLANKFGIKIILVIGTLGYVPWFAALYTNNRYGTEWFMLLGATLCGLSASCLWATEGAIAVSYPHTDDRAKATGLWLGLRQLGQIVGASIQLAMNIRSSNRGAVIYTVFYVFIAIACLGLPASLLVSSPHKAIRRRPGEPWTNVAPRRTTPSGKNTSWAVEFKRLWRVLKLKHMILLTMILITFDMNRVYIGIYMVQTISVRSRALTALVAGFAQVIADVFWGWFLDSKIIKSRKRRAQVCWALFSVLMFIGFAWFTYNEYNYSNQNPRPTLDWSRGGFAVGFIPPLLLYFMNEGQSPSSSLLDVKSKRLILACSPLYLLLLPHRQLPR